MSIVSWISMIGHGDVRMPIDTERTPTHISVQDATMESHFHIGHHHLFHVSDSLLGHMATENFSSGSSFC
jgi:hypothetical protein